MLVIGGALGPDAGQPDSSTFTIAADIFIPHGTVRMRSLRVAVGPRAIGLEIGPAGPRLNLVRVE